MGSNERVQVTPGSARVLLVADGEDYTIRLRISGKAPVGKEHAMWRESLDYALPAETYARSRSLGTANGFEYAGCLQAVCDAINHNGYVDMDPDRWIKVNATDFLTQGL